MAGGTLPKVLGPELETVLWKSSCHRLVRSHPKTHQGGASSLVLQQRGARFICLSSSYTDDLPAVLSRDPMARKGSGSCWHPLASPAYKKGDFLVCSTERAWGHPPHSDYTIPRPGTPCCDLSPSFPHGAFPTAQLPGRNRRSQWDAAVASMRVPCAFTGPFKPCRSVWGL